ncbi:MAG: hypothetical protein KQH57_08445 [Actinomycetales bacterium]|nr:hypothetical protein [Actinomycetales bacterium]
MADVTPSVQYDGPVLLDWLTYLDAWCDLSPTLGSHLVRGQHDNTRGVLTGRMYDARLGTFLDVDVCGACAHGLASIASAFTAETLDAVFAFRATELPGWEG